MRGSELTAAPDFALPDTTGLIHTLDDFLGRGSLLLAFHRGTW